MISIPTIRANVNDPFRDPVAAVADSKKKTEKDTKESK